MNKDISGGNSSHYAYEGSLLTVAATKGFFLGRSFRAYKEFTANTTLKFVATKPFLLTDQTLGVDAGAAVARISVGGTESGTWTALSTKFTKNGLKVITPDVAISQGGTVSGGTERDVLRASAGAGGNAATTQSNLSSPRLLPAGTYYITITVTGTTSGVYGIEYEEQVQAPA